jgi:hypothetical protein
MGGLRWKKSWNTPGIGDTFQALKQAAAAQYLKNCSGHYSAI